jgi:hypothetical protein
MYFQQPIRLLIYQLWHLHHLHHLLDYQHFHHLHHLLPILGLEQRLLFLHYLDKSK